MEFKISSIYNGKILKNIIANYMGSMVVSMVPIIVLPYYMNTFGPKLWGLVTFIGLLVSWLSILESGLSQALVKDFAEYSENNIEKAELLFGLEKIYWVFTVLVTFIGLAFSSYIANSFVNNEGMALYAVYFAIYSAIFLFIIQFPSSIYKTVLLGLQEHVLLNKIVISFIFVRNIIGVVLIYYYPYIYIYLLWQCICSLLEAILKYRITWKLLNIERKKLVWNPAQTYKAIKSGAFIVVSVMLGMAIMTIDKFYISKMLNLEQLAYYGVAYSLAIALLRFIHPIQVALQPKLIQLKKNSNLLRKVNIELMIICVLIIALIAVAYSYFGIYFLHLWLRNDLTVRNVYPVLSLLLIGSALNAIYNIGYINWIAKGFGNKIFKVNVFSLIISALILPLLISVYGINGACFSWILVNLIGLIISFDWLIKK